MSASSAVALAACAASPHAANRSAACRAADALWLHWPSCRCARAASSSRWADSLSSGSGSCDCRVRKASISANRSVSAGASVPKPRALAGSGSEAIRSGCTTKAVKSSTASRQFHKSGAWCAAVSTSACDSHTTCSVGIASASRSRTTLACCHQRSSCRASSGRQTCRRRRPCAHWASPCRSHAAGGSAEVRSIRAPGSTVSRRAISVSR